MLAEAVHQECCKRFSPVTDYDTGEVACSSCGAVSLERAADSGPESAGPAQEYRNSRTGTRISLKMADMGLATLIEAKDRDAAGRTLSSENRRIFYRLRMWDRNSRSASATRSFQKAFTMLDGIASKLALPESAVDEAAYLFRKISAKRMLAGRSTAAILCATVYIACRLSGTPRTLQDVADAGNIRRKSLQRVYRYLAKELAIYPKAFGPEEFISRIGAAVGISERTERLAYKILDSAGKSNVSTSKNPMAMAAASVHLAALLNREKIPQARISEASGISAVTIRDRTKEIRKMVGGRTIG